MEGAEIYPRKFNQENGGRCRHQSDLNVRNLLFFPGVGTVPVGKIETGVLKPGMTLKFSPAKLTAEVKSIEMHHQGLETALPGHNVGFNIKNVAVKNLRRGDVAGNAQQDPPSDVSSFEAQVGSVGFSLDYGGVTGGFRL